MTRMSEVCTTMNMERQKGFTVVELLITIVVVSILLATGVPSILKMVKNNRVTTQANKLVTSVQLGRNEAVKRGTRTTVCAANTTLDDCAGSTNWANGWIVFSNLDNDSTADTGTGAGDNRDLAIQSFEHLSPGFLIDSLATINLR